MAEFETLYENRVRVDPSSARDVLAFVLTPARAFTVDPDELEATRELLIEAKREAVLRFLQLTSRARRAGETSR